MLENINWFDLITIVLIVLFGLRGFVNGIIREIFGILGLIGGLILAVNYRAEAGAWISANIYNLHGANAIGGDGTEILAGFLGVLFATWIVCLIAGEILAKLIKFTGLGIIDKVGGFIFSAAKIFLIFAIVAVLIKSAAFLNTQTKPFFENSVTYPYLVKAGEFIMQIKNNENVKNAITEIKRDINNTLSDDFNETFFENDTNKSEILNRENFDKNSTL